MFKLIVSEIVNGALKHLQVNKNYAEKCQDKSLYTANEVAGKVQGG